MNKIIKAAGILLVVALGISLYGINNYRTLYRETEQKYEILESNFNELSDKFEKIQKEHADLLQKMESLQNSFDTIQRDYTSLYEDHTDLQEEYTTLQSSYTEKEKEYEDMEKKYIILEERYNRLQEKYDELEKKYTFSHSIDPYLFSVYTRMVSVYNQNIADLADELGDEKSFLGKIDSIFNYVSYQITYEPDPPDIEVIQSPIKTYQMKKGDCEDQAIFLACLLKIEGYRVRLNFADREHTFDDLKTEEFAPNHVTVSVYIPEEYQDEIEEYTSNKKYYIDGNWLWLEPTSRSYIGYTDEIYPFVYLEA
ncbi:MAG: hypothetical protein KAV80_03790 [Methanomicrobia archaeon]|nr:hypothetical protein [Methanomicrobia archaeon]